VVGTSKGEGFALSNVFLDGKQFGVRWNLYCPFASLGYQKKIEFYGPMLYVLIRRITRNATIRSP
jgi:hypothetical protein